MQINNPASVWRTEDQRFFAPTAEAKRARPPLTINNAFTNNAINSTVISNYVVVNVTQLPSVPESTLEQKAEEPSCWSFLKCCKR
jgi:hypothetical protein